MWRLKNKVMLNKLVLLKGMMQLETTGNGGKSAFWRETSLYRFISHLIKKNILPGPFLEITYWRSIMAEPLTH